MSNPESSGVPILGQARRGFLKTVGILSASLAWGACRTAHAEETGAGRAGAKPEPAKPPLQSLFDSRAKRIRVLPGQWRAHYPWEQIAWVSPPWPSEDYIWLDFPEAIFTSQGLLYLSHATPEITPVFPYPPRVAWRTTANGIAFDRELPNGVKFGGSVTTPNANGPTVDLTLYLKNGSSEKLADITLQTCAFLRAIAEFADYTRDNKFVHLTDEGWMPLSKALTMAPRAAGYRVGWRTKGKKMADLPVLATVSNAADRLVAMTWFGDTVSLISNGHHPCMHADPFFHDLVPGEEATIHGKLIFHEGGLKDFDFTTYCPVA